MSGPLAYFITFHTYGSWLHGRAEGSVDQEHRAYGQPFLPTNLNRETARQNQLKHPAYLLDEKHRIEVLASIKNTCLHRDWQVHALHVRQNHVHMVITAVTAKPEKVLSDIKAYATRNLRTAGLLGKDAPAWSEHGSTRYLWTEEQVVEKCHYTLHEQGKPMQRWPPQSEQVSSEHEA